MTELRDTMDPDDFAQCGTVYTGDPTRLHLDDGLRGEIARDDGPICGARDRAHSWTCLLPPGHECRHLRAGDELLEGWGPLRVARLWSGA